MAGRKDIEAGKAFITLFLKKGALTKGLESLRKQLNQFSQQAQKLGTVFQKIGVSLTGPMLAAAAASEDVRKKLTSIHQTIGKAIAPALMPILDAAQKIAERFAAWAENNQQLLTTMFKLGVAALALGAALKGIGLVASLAAFLATPLGVITAGLAAAAAMAFKFSSTVREAFGGIGDALLAGDLELAGQIAMTSLQILFQTGVVKLANILGMGLGDAVAQIGTQVLQGDLEGAFISTSEAMGATWDTFVSGMVMAFQGAIVAIEQMWKASITGMQATIGGMQATLRKLGLGTAASALGTIAGGLAVGGGGAGNVATGVGRTLAGGFGVGNVRATPRGFSPLAGATGAAEAELAELRKKFEEMRARAAQGAAANPFGVGGATTAVSTFSAAGAAALGAGGGSIQAKTYSEIREHKKIAAESLRLQKEQAARRDRPGLFK
jgi:hypothetical protein